MLQLIIKEKRLPADAHVQLHPMQLRPRSQPRPLARPGIMFHSVDRLCTTMRMLKL